MRTHLKALVIICGTEALVGYPMARETIVTMAAPSMNLARMSSSVMSRIDGWYIAPLSYTIC